MSVLQHSMQAHVCPAAVCAPGQQQCRRTSGVEGLGTTTTACLPAGSCRCQQGCKSPRAYRHTLLA
jgi:hypothetical protein